MMAESRFLAARESRYAYFAGRCKRKEQRQEFWSEFNPWATSWKSRLDTLVSNVHTGSGDSNLSPAQTNEQQVLNLISEMDALHDELISCKKYCLSDGHANLAPSSFTTAETMMQIIGGWDTLPLGDIKLLHDEFTTLQCVLDAARSKANPRKEFVFVKYRRAYEEYHRRRQLNQVDQHQQASDAKFALNIAIPSKLSVEDTSRNDLLIKSLLSGSKVVEDVTGEHLTMEQLPVSESISISTALAPIVVRNTCGSVIELSNESCPSIHVLNVMDSTILLPPGMPISGAIHVTGCQGLTLKVFRPIQQLRLHESKNMCILLTSNQGGVILEDCTSVVFVVESGLSTFDVKDFSFLHRGVPSPNYIIEHFSSHSNPDSLMTTVSLSNCMFTQKKKTAETFSSTIKSDNSATLELLSNIHEYDDEDDEM